VYTLSDFDFALPKELIAQQPLSDPSPSRLLVIDRATGGIRHQHLRDLLELIPPEDVLVNNTDRVLPARMPGKGDRGEEVEVMVMHESHDGSWLATLGPELETGRRVTFGEDSALEIDVRSMVAVNESTAHMTSLLAGLGISQTFGFAAASHTESGRLVAMLEDWSRPPHPLHILYPPNRHLNAKLRVFVDWVAEVFATINDRERGPAVL